MTRLLSRRAILASVTAVACTTVLLAGAPGATASPSEPTLPATPTPTPSTTAEEPGGEAPAVPAEPVVPPDPLHVVIERLTPSALDGRVDAGDTLRMSGTVTNRSDEQWTDLGVYLVRSLEPITTAPELDAALTSDPRTDIGPRLVEAGLYVDVGALEPGESTTFDLSVPIGRLGLSGEPGVYWVGAHVLGTNSLGRLEGADGRTRTFLPLVPERNAGTELALGVQFRNHIVRASDGRLEYLDGWQATLAEGGRLRRLLQLSTSAPADLPLTWVLDPAVVDAALSVAEGNPVLDVAPTADEGEDGEDGEDGENGEGDDEGDGGADEDGRSDGGASPEESAREWVDAFFDEAADHSLLTLPYGDLDVSSAARHGVSDLLTTAFSSSTLVLAARDTTATPVLLPPSGHLSPAAFDTLEPGLPVVLDPDAVADGGDRGPLLNRTDGGRVLLAPVPDDLWGPEPGAPRSALAVRQRILADAALHALSPGRGEPLVRFLPPGWDPGDRWQRARFFAGLDVGWLDPTNAASIVTGVSTDAPVDPTVDLVYPDEELEAQLPLPTVLATESLIAEGTLVEELITADSEVDEQVVRQALLTSSVWSRLRPGLAAERAVDARDRVTGWLDEVSVRGPAFVTMSSETGTFQVTVVNGLDQQVTVGLQATVPGGDLELITPEPIELAPNSRGAMRIDATSTDIGVHLVTLQPVSTEGTPLGQSTTVSIRSSRVGLILWIVMAIGGTALFVAIVLRIWRRVRQRRRTHGPRLKQAEA